MTDFISKMIEKYRKNFEPIVGQKNYEIMKNEAMKKLIDVVPELYENFLKEEFGKWVQVYMD
jgi:hypothetical protein